MCIQFIILDIIYIDIDTHDIDVLFTPRRGGLSDETRVNSGSLPTGIHLLRFRPEWLSALSPGTTTYRTCRAVLRRALFVPLSCPNLFVTDWARGDAAYQPLRASRADSARSDCGKHPVFPLADGTEWPSFGGHCHNVMDSDSIFRAQGLQRPVPKDL